MKKLLIIPIIILFISCEEKINYPVYSLVTKEIVPDSLKSKHRTFITETVRAANQHLSAGDYEDIDETIIQAERTADNIFSVKVVCLNKQIDDKYWNDLVIFPKEFTDKEKKIFDNLIKN